MSRFWSRSGILKVDSLGAALDQTLVAPLLLTVNDPADAALTDQQLWDWMRAQPGGHFVVNNVDQGPGTTIDMPAPTLGAAIVPSGVPVPSVDGVGGGVPASDLVVGPNTVTLSASNTIEVANIDILLAGAGAPGGPISTPPPVTTPPPPVAPCAIVVKMANGRTAYLDQTSTVCASAHP